MCSLNSYCSLAESASIVGSMILLGEILEWSLRPVTRGRFNGSNYLVPSKVTKKCVGVDPSAKHLGVVPLDKLSAVVQTVRSLGPDGS